MSRGPVSALLLALVLVACGASTIVTGQGSIGSASPVVGEMRRAEAIAGHPIALEIDPGITTGTSRELAVSVVTHAAEVVAGDLASLREQDPTCFASQVRRVARIACRYSGGGVQPVRWEGATLVVTHNYRGEALAAGELAQALRDDYYAALARRFAGVTPERVAPLDRRDYFAFLVHGVARDDGMFRVGSAPAAIMESVLRLAAIAGTEDAALTADLRAWLFGRARSIALADPSTVQTPEQQQARAAWVRWLGATLPSATPSEKLKVASTLFENLGLYGKGRQGIAGTTIEGLDLFGFGLSIADAWIAAGHPADGVDDPSHRLFRLVLQPPELDTHGNLPRFNYGSSPWLGAAFTTDPQGKRLADALAARNDAGLMGQVVYNLPRGDEGVDPHANLLQQLERYPTTWRAMVGMLIAQQMAYEGCSEGLVDEANRVWRNVPALRGTALHVIACREGFRRGISDDYFKQFPRLYGTTVGATLFGAFLDDGADALRLADVLWPAMSPGWSRASVVIPHLDAFLADPRVRAGEDGEPMHTLGAIAVRLCQDGPPEVERFHDALAARAKTDVATARALAKVLDDTAPGRCAAPEAQTRSRGQ